jgi:excisionase family DNA binding protein
MNRTSQYSQSPVLGERLLDVDEMAALFKCSRDTVLRWCRKGKIPAFKAEKPWFVRHSDIVRYMEDRLQSGGHLRRSEEIKQ